MQNSNKYYHCCVCVLTNAPLIMFVNVAYLCVCVVINFPLFISAHLVYVIQGPNTSAGRMVQLPISCDLLNLKFTIECAALLL